MARPTPIIVPGGLGTSRTATNVNVDAGALINMFENLARQRREQGEQQQAVEALQSLFGPKQPAPAPVSEELAGLGGEVTGGGPQVNIPAPVPTSQEQLAFQAQKEQQAPLFQTLAATPQGRQQFTQQALKGLFGTGKTETQNKFQTFKASLLEQEPDIQGTEIVKRFEELNDTTTKVAPTNLAKLISERATLLDGGMQSDNSVIKAYDSKISGVDIDIDDLTEDEIAVFGSLLNLNGRMPSLGRGKQAAKMRIAIAKSAASQALAQDPNAPPETPGKTPSEAAFSILEKQTDTKAIQGSLNFLDKQISSMGSFVTNMESQVNKVKALSKDLKTFDTRLLNIPLRTMRGRLVGSPLQAKYDLYLSEIESEIGKMATGSTASVAELSVGAQERWAKIHDKNLSVPDMISLLDETLKAAKLREDSVQKQLDKTRGRMRRENITPVEPKTEKTTGEIEFLGFE